METDQSTSADDAAETDMRETVKMYERKLKDLEAEFERCLGELKVTMSISEKESHPPTDHALPYKKEFKIQGQIGDPGQRDKLAFMSLVHQIDSGLKRGYPEKEIVEAVVRAVTPGLQLRDYLEGRDDLDLPITRRLLRAHFQERGATELYQELCGISQGRIETAQNFVLRALALKQRVLFASKEANAKFKYDQTLVESMFEHAVSTGLSNAEVRQEVKNAFSSNKCSEEDLLERVNQASHSEAERARKMQLKKPVTASVEMTGNDRHKPEVKKEKSPNLYEEVQLLKTQVAEIHKAITAGGRAKTFERRPRGCSDCQQDGIGDSCRHCYKCGKFGHLSRGCLAGKQQGNANRSPLGDEKGPQAMSMQ